MTSKEFASEKKFIYVAKYYGKCQVRKDETPVAEYYQNPYNPNDKRTRQERKFQEIPQFIITRHNKESSSLNNQHYQQLQQQQSIDINLTPRKQLIKRRSYIQIGTSDRNSQKLSKTPNPVQQQSRKMYLTIQTCCIRRREQYQIAIEAFGNIKFKFQFSTFVNLIVECRSVKYRSEFCYRQSHNQLGADYYEFQ
eukprot:403350933